MDDVLASASANCFATIRYFADAQWIQHREQKALSEYFVKTINSNIANGILVDRTGIRWPRYLFLSGLGGEFIDKF